MEKASFVSVCLEENLVQTAIWNIKDKAANVISTSPSVNYEDDETLISACDECLSGCIQNLPEDLDEPNKAIFGVPSYWVKDGQIERQYLDKIRLLCDKLSLNPVGFVSLPESIAHFEKNVNETPFSGVLIGIYKGSIDVSLFRLGNLAGTVNVARSLSIADDIIEGIARFGTNETIPSKFLLYDGHKNDLEEIRQDIIKTDWIAQNDNIKFLHAPAVDIVDADTKMATICLAGAAEIANLTQINFNSSKIQKASEITNTKDESHLPFQAQPAAEEENLVSPESLGFTSSAKNIIPVARGKSILKAPSLVANLIKKIPLKENTAFILSILAIFLFAALFAAYWFLPSMEINIIVSPVKIDESRKIIFDTKANRPDASKLTVPAKQVTTTITLDKTKQTSGTKTVGTPAKGAVTFYNVGGATTIPKGTILTSSNIKYSLDDDVPIASGSGAAQSSTATGNITALSVGADANLASGSIFSVGNFSNSLIQAKNDEALSGGTSQEVAAVSKDDISALTSSLIQDITNQGKDKLKENLVGDVLIENNLTTKPISTSLDHKEGEEATTVKLTITAKVEGITVSKDDMYALAKEIFKDKVKPGYAIKDDQIDFMPEGTNIRFKINLLPSIDTEKLKNQISGKSTNEARAIIKKIASYKDVKFFPKPNLSFLPVPHVVKNISITVGSD